MSIAFSVAFLEIVNTCQSWSCFSGRGRSVEHMCVGCVALQWMLLCFVALVDSVELWFSMPFALWGARTQWPCFRWSVPREDRGGSFSCLRRRGHLGTASRIAHVLDCSCHRAHFRIVCVELRRQRGLLPGRPYCCAFECGVHGQFRFPVDSLGRSSEGNL